MSTWKEYKLGEIAEIVMGQSPTGETCNESGNGIPLLNGPTEFGSSFPRPVQFTIDPKKFAKPLDILFCVRGSTTGKMNWADRDYAIGRGLAAIRHRQGEKYRHFVKGLIDINLNLLLQSATGSTFPNVSKDQLNNISILAPDLGVQESISEILSSIEDKIELNNQINKNLEGLAEALYKQWFIDFEFPNEHGQPYKTSAGEMIESDLGQIPKQFKVGLLSEVLEIKYGKDHKHLGTGNIPVYGSGGIMRYADEALYSNHSILIPRKGTLNNLFYLSKPFWTVDTMFYSVIKEDCLRKYVFYFIKAINLASMNVGSAVPSMTTKILNDIKIVIPSPTVLQNFENIISSLFNQMEELEQETKSLESLRSVLLPKLISGELQPDL